MKAKGGKSRRLPVPHQPARDVKQAKTDPARRRWFRGALAALLVAATLAVLFVMDAIAALFAPLPSSQFIRNARLNHTWPPNTQQTHREWIAENPDFPEPYVHHYNAQGWIETYDVQQQKPPGTYRIFYVGDSFTEGCVPMDQSVASRVESHLNANHADKETRYEVINAGTASYSPVLQYILIRYELLNYEPDLIVINVDMTDDFDDWKYRQTLVTDEAGNPFACAPRAIYEDRYIDTIQGAVKAGPLDRVRLFLMHHSHLYNLISGSRSQAELNGMHFFQDPQDSDTVAPNGDFYPRWAWCQHEWAEPTRKNVDYTINTLQRIGELCRQHKIKLMLTGVPHYPQLARDEAGEIYWSRRPHEEIRQVAQQVGAVYLDSIAAMGPHVEGTEQHELYYKGDMHLNPRGNALWAEAHIRAIVDPTHGLLPLQ